MKKRSMIGLTSLWLSLWLLYLVAAGGSDIEEVIAGGLVSAAASLLSVRGRSTSQASLVPRLVWLKPFLKVPWTVLQESWLLLTALVKKISAPGAFQGGSFIEYPLPSAPQDGASSRHAITTIGVCLTPNDYIVGINYDRNVALVRILVGRELSGTDKAFLELK